MIFWSGWWLNPTPLKKMSSSIGMMKVPTELGKKALFQITNQSSNFYWSFPF